MNRRDILKLHERVQKLKSQFSPAVSILLHGDGEYRLTCNAWAGTSGRGTLTKETVHATDEEAKAAYELFIKAHPSPSTHDAVLIIIDV